MGDYYVCLVTVPKKTGGSGWKSGLSRELAEKEAPLMKSLSKCWVDWEAGQPEVMELWQKMNGWVCTGFDITYKRIGSDFDGSIMRARPICWERTWLKRD